MESLHSMPLCLHATANVCARTIAHAASPYSNVLLSAPPVAHTICLSASIMSTLHLRVSCTYACSYMQHVRALAAKLIAPVPLKLTAN